MSGFTENEIKAELSRRAKARSGKGWEESEQSSYTQTTCLNCGHAIRSTDATDQEEPICDICL